MKHLCRATKFCLGAVAIPRKGTARMQYLNCNKQFYLQANLNRMLFFFVKNLSGLHFINPEYIYNSLATPYPKVFEG